MQSAYPPIFFEWERGTRGKTDLEKGQIALVHLENPARKRSQGDLLPATQEKKLDFILPFSSLAVFIAEAGKLRKKGQFVVHPPF